MRRDPNIYIAGEDVGKFGGSFGVTGSVYKEFGPGRVLDTPISETAIIGHAVGAAAAGLRPVVEILFMDFLPIASDELCNQAAKIRYMFGGQVTCPLVVRTATGAGMGAAAHHSQSLEAWICHTPGLKTIAPCHPGRCQRACSSRPSATTTRWSSSSTRCCTPLRAKSPRGTTPSPSGKRT